MSDKNRVFVDTNVLVYGFYGLDKERNRVVELFRTESYSSIISTQVLKEFTNASLKKRLNKNRKELESYLIEIQSSFIIYEINLSTILSALDVKEQYKYSFYDSLIIATAIQNNCEVLFSEDLQHGQMIGKKMKIVNPFK